MADKTLTCSQCGNKYDPVCPACIRGEVVDSLTIKDVEFQVICPSGHHCSAFVFDLKAKFSRAYCGKCGEWYDVRGVKTTGGEDDKHKRTDVER